MKFLAVFLLLCVPAMAKPKPVYQDAVLVSFRTVSTGSTCTGSGNVKGQTDNNGDVTGTSTANSNCSDNQITQYTISVGDTQLTLEPSFSGKQKGAAFATMGWSALFTKPSVLYNKLPGTHILVRNGDDCIYVKIGKKESRYSIVAAR